MKFDAIDPSLTSDEIDLASIILSKIMVELGIRENNEHVGSGLGGNNHQLLVFMTMKHHLVSSPDNIVVINNTVYWGIEFLIGHKMTYIRPIIDKAFKLVSDENKLLALALHTTANNPISLLSVLENTLPQIVVFYYNEFLSGQALNLSKLSYTNQFILALLICAKLSYFLDSNIEVAKYKMIVGQSLDSVEPEIFLLAVRKAINIDRVIEHYLDENPYWNLNRITRLVN